MNRKIIMSLGVVVFVAALSWGATGAFFSDSETSTGNIRARTSASVAGSAATTTATISAAAAVNTPHTVCMSL